MPATVEPTPSALEQQLAQAQLAFVGRSEAVPASLPGVATIRVVELVKGPPVLARLAGQAVQLLVHQPLGAGVVRGFLADRVSLGAEVSATEIRRCPPEQLTAASGRAAGGTHAPSAGVVVVGRVLSVDDAGLSTGVTEHDPQWTVARVAVDHVEHGDLEGAAAGGVVDVLFPRSEDTAWAGSPKLAPDQVRTLTIEGASGELAGAAPYVLVAARP
ncbi:MAG: hypothetical protein JOZ82_06935 [Marmoricola sp.]|nr:hypothetical protein [Marmoricola sp.]